jgi:hypothetical protein
MKYLFLICLFIISSITVNAQKVTGKIVDGTTGEGMFGIVVLLMNKSDTTIFVTSEVGDDGSFSFDQVKSATYIFKSLFLGFKSVRLEITVSNLDINMGRIKMYEDETLMKEIEVKGKMLRMEQNDDTVSIHADAYKTNPDATVEDLVAKMPGMSVVNGTVQSNGQTIQKVTVDGEEFFGNDAILVLRNLPAEIVDKIQVYDKLSDQAQASGFDDGNSQKTINIVTKQDKRNGQFGKLYAGYGTNNRYSTGFTLNSFKGKQRITLLGLSNNINVQNFSPQDLTGLSVTSGRAGPSGGSNASSNFLVGQQNGVSTTNSFGLNYSDTWSKKLKVSANYFFNQSKNVNSTNLDRQYFLTDTTSTIYTENNDAITKNYNHRLSARLEYAYDSSTSIIYTPSINFQNQNVSQNLMGVNRYLTDSLLSSTTNNNGNESNNYSIINNVFVRHKYKKKGRSLMIMLGSTINVNDGNTNLYSSNQYAEMHSQSKIVNQNGINNTQSYAYNTSIRYTEPLSKSSVLQFNYSPSYTKSYANKRINNYNPTTGEYDSASVFVSNQLDNYTLTQKGGIGYRFQNKKTNLMLNADYQNVALSSTQLYPYNNTIGKEFNNILPSGMLKIKFSDSSNIKIRYRASTNIPGVNQLQSVINNSNTLLLSSGNQNLKQEYTNTLNVNYALSSSNKATNSLIFLNINQTNNFIGSSSLIATSDTVVDSNVKLNKGSQLNKPINLNGYWNVNSFYNYGFPVSLIKSNISLNTGVVYIRTPGMINQRTNISNAYALNGGFGVSSNISKKVDFNLTYNASYNIVDNSIRPQLNNNYFYHLAVAKVNVMPFKGLVLATDITQRLYSGLSSSFNQQFYLWNAAIGYKFLKDQSLEVRVSVFDLLNQNRSIARTVSQNYVQDTYTTVLTRYFMFTVTYNIKKFKTS